MRAARAVDEGESAGETEIMYRDNNNIHIRSARVEWEKLAGRKGKSAFSGT